MKQNVSESNRSQADLKVEADFESDVIGHWDDACSYTFTVCFHGSVKTEKYQLDCMLQLQRHQS